MNPLHVVAIPFLRRLAAVPASPTFAEVLRRHLDETHATDPQIVQVALGAIGSAGYQLSDFEGVGGYGNFQAAVQAAISLLQAQ